MELFEVIKTRRSVRAYKSDAIPEDIVTRVLEATRLAPSGSNRQPWKYILVRSKEVKKKIATLCGGQMWIAESPIVIVACGMDLHYDRGGYMGGHSFLIDSGIGLTHLILAARAEGLGTCWIGLFDNESLKELLDIPPNWYVAAVTPLGYPLKADAFNTQTKRKELKEIVSEETWG